MHLCNYNLYASKHLCRNNNNGRSTNKYPKIYANCPSNQSIAQIKWPTNNSSTGFSSGLYGGQKKQQYACFLERTFTSTTWWIEQLSIDSGFAPSQGLVSVCLLQIQRETRNSVISYPITPSCSIAAIEKNRFPFIRWLGLFLSEIQILFNGSH